MVLSAALDIGKGTWNKREEDSLQLSCEVRINGVEKLYESYFRKQKTE